MPLLMSPIDGSPMRQINRFGIEIDVCPTSGGIWLDKGELEKLMALLREEALNDQSSSGGHHPSPRDIRQRDPDDDDDHDDYKSGQVFYDRDRRFYEGKKSKMSRIMEIFDF